MDRPPDPTKSQQSEEVEAIEDHRNDRTPEPQPLRLLDVGLEPAIQDIGDHPRECGNGADPRRGVEDPHAHGIEREDKRQPTERELRPQRRIMSSSKPMSRPLWSRILLMPSV